MEAQRQLLKQRRPRRATEDITGTGDFQIESQVEQQTTVNGLDAVFVLIWHQSDFKDWKESLEWKR